VARAVKVIAIACVLAAASPSRADSPKLGEAERAIDTVHYDDAQKLLVAALADGGNSPAAVRRIYQLSAMAATVLGQRELAEQYYRRWLALEPTAHLDGVAPKLREPFTAAQAYMAAHGRFTAHATRIDAATVDVTVDTDPLAMAVSTAADGAAIAFDPNHHATLRTAALTVAILDERGNGLVDLPVGAPAERHDVPDPRDPRIEPAPVVDPPFMKRWTTWAVPSGAFIVAGSILGIVALNQQQQLTEALTNSREHFYTEVDDLHRAVRRNATIGIALGAVGAVLAIPAAVFYIQQRKPNDLSPSPINVNVAPIVTPSGAGFVVGGTF
jgi:hypothetical protein